MIQVIDSQLSEGLISLLETFEPHLGFDIEVKSGNVDKIVHSLRVMRRLAMNMERELAVLRLSEDGRAASNLLNEESVVLLSDAMRRGEGDADANVVTPDFWRKS